MHMHLALDEMKGGFFPAGFRPNHSPLPITSALLSQRGQEPGRKVSQPTSRPASALETPCCPSVRYSLLHSHCSLKH